jgi:beta-lactam-binding protein with PASTA domain
MAEVYLANDRILGRQVALKILSSRYAHDAQFIERFRREASSAASLNHPNIVQIYDRGEAEDTYYIAMEYLEGRSLKEIILKYAPLSPDLVVSISVQILEALRFAHRRDVIHRDIKPQNIIVDSEGRVKVTDFGIARAGSASTMTEAGSIIGTAPYLSPEQARGQPVEAASDLYSLGVVMYEMVSGKLPFDGDNPVGIAMQHAHELPVVPRTIKPEIPENLEAVILRALGKQPVERYLTAQAMLDDLRKVQDGEPVSPPAAFIEEVTQVMAPAAVAAAAQPTEVRPRGGQPKPLPEPYYGDGRRRRSVWPWLLVIVLLLALGGGAYAVFSNWNSAAAEIAVVPGVIGLSEDEARQEVEAAGFDFKLEGEQPSADVEVGSIARQDPEEGVELALGEQVSVWLSSGEGKVEVPDVVGKTQVAATQELLALGLDVTSKEETVKDKEVGTVIRQSPAGGQQVDAGVTVTIVVVAPSNTVEVPRLIGMTQDSAVALLEGMKLVPVVKERDSTEPGKTVVDQDPREGEEVEPGTEITIYVSNAPEVTTVKVPPVAQMGFTVSQARSRLATYGLRSSTVEAETPDYPAGEVIGQDPAAGVEVEKGSIVRLTVAKEPPSTTTTTQPSTTTTTQPSTTTTTQPSTTTTTQPTTTTPTTSF